MCLVIAQSRRCVVVSMLVSASRHTKLFHIKCCNFCLAQTTVSSFDTIICKPNREKRRNYIIQIGQHTNRLIYWLGSFFLLHLLLLLLHIIYFIQNDTPIGMVRFKCHHDNTSSFCCIRTVSAWKVGRIFLCLLWFFLNDTIILMRFRLFLLLLLLFEKFGDEFFFIELNQFLFISSVCAVFVGVQNVCHSIEWDCLIWPRYGHWIWFYKKPCIESSIFCRCFIRVTIEMLCERDFLIHSHIVFDRWEMKWIWKSQVMVWFVCRRFDIIETHEWGWG